MNDFHKGGANYWKTLEWFENELRGVLTRFPEVPKEDKHRILREIADANK